MNVRYATVCSGIEAMSVAAGPLGWTPVFFSEIHPFANAVLKHHYPHVANVGDMLNIRGSDYEGKIDLLAGGTPCQSFSKAGLRKGLADPRGQLTPAFARLAYGARVPWLIWENVPGLLSDDQGKTFARVLHAFTGLPLRVPEGGWKNAGAVRGAPGCYSLAWRVLDCQHCRVDGYPHGLPQTRRRIWAVGHLGDWRAPAEILLGDVPVEALSGTVRLPGDPDTAAPAGSAANPVYIVGSVIGRDPANEFLRRQKGWRTGAAFTLTTRHFPYVLAGDRVRRMTCVECERLMGFPDGYTDIAYNGNPPGDTTRVFVLGNSWAVNCARWVVSRIDAYLEGTLQK